MKVLRINDDVRYVLMGNLKKFRNRPILKMKIKKSYQDETSHHSTMNAFG